MAKSRVALIGAGRIAEAHLTALGHTPGVEVSAIVDPYLPAAKRLAAQAPGDAAVFATIEDMLAAQRCDRAHVLVPPPLHAAIGQQLIEASVPCFMEKPLGVTPAEAQHLVATAQRMGVPLGVNQNYIFHPAFQAFKRAYDAGRYGRIQSISLTVAAPLPQLQARQFGHWMFERPTHIILEQLVHPLSQILHMMPNAKIASAVAAPPVFLAPGMAFHRSFHVGIENTLCSAQLHMTVGASYPVWMLNLVCEDALVVVDGIKNTCIAHRRSRFLEAGDTALQLAQQGGALLGHAAFGLAQYLGAQLRLMRRSDAFYRSLEASVRAFHQAVDTKTVPLSDGVFGAAIVDLASQIAQQAGVSAAPALPPATVCPRDAPLPDYDVAVFGGTGFIGQHVVEQLLAAGYRVGVMARGMRGLAACFHDPRVVLVPGDVTQHSDVLRGLGEAHTVINLAHGSGRGGRAEIVDALVGSARIVANACIEKRVRRLIFISSIAALYLGDAGVTIHPSTPCDPQTSERSDYAHAKAEAERVLRGMALTHQLPLVILRPGLVVGAGASPFHSGLGLFNNEQHCLGWNSGRNPLPFVLVEDTAKAIVAAVQADDRVLGRADNIVGGVRLSARDYIEALKEALARPLVFHPQSVAVQQGIEYIKWLIKRVGGKRVPVPSRRDLLSRGLKSPFDTSETEAVLGWSPVKERALFMERAITAQVD